MKTKNERIAALIANDQTPYTDADKAALEALSEDQITVIEGQDRGARIAALIGGTFPVEKVVEKEVEKVVEKTVTVAATYKTVDEALAAMPGDIRDLMASGLRVGKEKKTATIKTLTESKRCSFSADELQAMSQDQLDKLVTLSGVDVVRTDFSGQAPVAPDNGANQAAPAPPDMLAALAAKK